MVCNSQRKIYEEMEQIFGDSKRLATMADLHEMRYLECCIKESLRLYPSVPFIARNLTQETVLSKFCHANILAIFIFNVKIQ